MAYDMTGDSTGGDLPFPKDSYERDRLRIQRELERDLNHASFSSSLSGLENVGNTYLDDDSIEINYDPRTKGKVNMLASSPDINSRILVNEFADFSMAGNEFEDEVETGRGPRFANRYDDKAHRSPARVYSLPRNIGSAKSKRLSDAYTAAGRAVSPTLRGHRHHSLSTVHSEPSEYLSVRTKMPTPGKPNENQQPTTTDDLSLHLPQAMHSTPKKPQANRQPSVESSSGGKPRKTTEQNPEYHGRLRDDDVSSVASEILGDIKNAKQKHEPLSSFKSNSALKMTTNKGHEPKRKVSRTQPPIPKSFQSTEEFIKELGLGGHTTTINLHNQLNKSLHDQDKGDATSTQEPSFLLPQIAGISELINAEATRLYQSSMAGSARKRGPGGAPPSHKPIESIPVPEENRAILMAMQLLQERVAGLEKQKEIYDSRVNGLKAQLRETKKMYDVEYARAKIAEAEVERRKRADRRLGKAEEEADRKAAERERIRATLTAENKQLRETVDSQKEQLDNVHHHLEITKTVLRNMQDERNTAVTTVAAAIATQEDLKQENADLRAEIEDLKAERLDLELKLNTEKEAWKAKEEKLRRRIDRARDAEATTRKELESIKKRFGETKDTALIDSTTEEFVTETVEQKTQEKGMSELVRRELEKMRPDLFPPTASSNKQAKQKSRIGFGQPPATQKVAATIRKSGVTAQQPSATGSTSTPTADVNPMKSTTAVNRKTGRRVTLRDVRDITELPTNRSVAKEQEIDVDVEEDAGNETAYTINCDYIRRIADEIDEERRRRKAAEKKAAAADAEIRKLAQENEFVKAVVEKRHRNSVTKTAFNKSSSEHTANHQADVADGSPQLGRPFSAPPIAINTPLVAPQQIPINMPKKRRIKKIVYYEEGDTTEIIPERTMAAIRGQQQAAAAEPAPTSAELVEPSSSNTHKYFSKPAANVYVPVPVEPSFVTAKNGKNHHRPSTSTIEVVDGAVLPKPPVLPKHIQQILETNEEHDPKACTVCVRKEQQGTADPDKPTVLPIPTVIPVSEQRAAGKPGTYHEASTIRPSEPPRKQLSKVVKQLQDEFVHLKMAYQEKTEEFLSLDPSRGKRRRKAITIEINELVEQMDYKCDQIYALYDVVEEVASKRKSKTSSDFLSQEFLKRHGNAEVTIYSEEDEIDYRRRKMGSGQASVHTNNEDTSMMLPNGLGVNDDETSTTEIGIEQARSRRIRHDHQNIADTSAEMEVADTYEESLLL